MMDWNTPYLFIIMEYDIIDIFWCSHHRGFEEAQVSCLSKAQSIFNKIACCNPSTTTFIVAVAEFAWSLVEGLRRTSSHTYRQKNEMIIPTDAHWFNVKDHQVYHGTMRTVQTTKKFADGATDAPVVSSEWSHIPSRFGSETQTDSNNCQHGESRCDNEQTNHRHEDIQRRSIESLTVIESLHGCFKFVLEYRPYQNPNRSQCYDEGVGWGVNRLL